MKHILTITAPTDAKGKALWLRANGGHGDRWAKADLIRTWRGLSTLQARLAKTPRIDGRVRIIATVHLTTKGRHWDAGNWAPTAKACVDGLQLHPRLGGVDVLAGDCNCFVEGPDMRAGEAWADAALVLTIEAIR